MKHTDPLPKPILDENTFQLLLSAGYMLQQHHDGLLAQATPVACAGPPPSVRNTVRPAGSAFGLRVPRMPAGLLPAPASVLLLPASSTRPPSILVAKRGKQTWFRGLTWASLGKACEGFAVAAVFGCMLVNVTMQRISPLSSARNLLSAVERAASPRRLEPIAALEIGGKPATSLDRLQSEGDFVAPDTVTRYGRVPAIMTFRQNRLRAEQASE